MKRSAQNIEADHTVERWIGRILRLGVWSSAALMVSGLVAAWLAEGRLVVPDRNPSPSQVFRSLFSGSRDPLALMFGGLVLLMLIPFLRVLTAFAGFAVEKDRVFAIVSLVVFALLTGELLYSLR